MSTERERPALDHARVEQFIEQGFIKIEGAFPRETAERARAVLWPDTGCDPNDASTWKRPVVRLGMYTQEPFVTAANTPVLHGAFDSLVGVNRWQPCMSMGTFPVRFPSSEDPGDVGWHIDVSFGTEDPDFMSWRANVVSKGRALLMLFLFSDVGDDDAPTRIRVGSHRDIARVLAPAGNEGLALRDLAASGFGETERWDEALASGEAGTVYLCHPFLVHSAQLHRGTRPRFMAQPPLLPTTAFRVDGDERDASAVEVAIRRALRDERQ